MSLVITEYINGQNRYINSQNLCFTSQLIIINNCYFFKKIKLVVLIKDRLKIFLLFNKN